MIRMSDAGPNPRTSTHLFYQQKEEAGTGTAGNKNKTANKKQDRREIFLTVFFLTKKCYPQKKQRECIRKTAIQSESPNTRGILTCF